MKYKVLKKTIADLTNKSNAEGTASQREASEGNIVKSEYHKGMSAGLRFATSLLEDRKGL